MRKMPVLMSMAAVLSAGVCAQEEAGEATLEERVLALERGYASLDTRLNAHASSGIGAFANSNEAISIERRLTQLESLLDRLTADLQRIERAADAAMREAGQARREAESAERIAREASLRAR